MPASSPPSTSAPDPTPSPPLGPLLGSTPLSLGVPPALGSPLHVCGGPFHLGLPLGPPCLSSGRFLAGAGICVCALPFSHWQGNLVDRADAHCGSHDWSSMSGRGPRPTHVQSPSASPPYSTPEPEGAPGRAPRSGRAPPPRAWQPVVLTGWPVLSGMPTVQGPAHPRPEQSHGEPGDHLS